HCNHPRLQQAYAAVHSASSAPIQCAIRPPDVPDKELLNGVPESGKRELQ
nr:hypothetical protein [Tanacetum cinerariifolium]